MDTPIAHPRRAWQRPALALAAVLAVAALAWWSREGAALLGASQTLARERITVAAVTAGRFDDFIALRGQAAPQNTVFLDSVEGGRIERKLVEDGALVAGG